MWRLVGPVAHLRGGLCLSEALAEWRSAEWNCSTLTKSYLHQRLPDHYKSYMDKVGTDLSVKSWRQIAPGSTAVVPNMPVIQRRNSINTVGTLRIISCITQLHWIVVTVLFLIQDHAMKTLAKWRYSSTHSFDLDTRWKWVVSFTPRPLQPQGKSPWYPLDRKLGGPQSPDRLARSPAPRR
jgi:hypothetical protein